MYQNTIMSYSDKIKSIFKLQKFDLDFESKMVQARILSPILEEIENKGLNQSDLSELSGLTQPFISQLFNYKRKLSMEHIARLQNALEIILQAPISISKNEHNRKFYDGDNKQIQIYINSHLHDTLNEIPSIYSTEKLPTRNFKL